MSNKHSARPVLPFGYRVNVGCMTLPAMNAEMPGHDSNVRLVVVDDKHQHPYLKRAVQ